MSRLIQPRPGRSVQSTAPPPTPPTRATPLESVLVELRGRQGGRGLFNMIAANFESAVEALWANRTRSFLTMLGIFIGVAAVIAALTLTQGTSAYIDSKVASLGTTILVFPGAARGGGVSQGTGSISSLTTKDADALAALPHVVADSPIITANDTVIYQNQNWSTQIEGATPDLQAMQNWQLARGTWFTTEDENSGTPVAVLGDTVMHNLFDNSGNNPIGQQIRIRGQVYRVVGVLTAQGGGLSQDDLVIIPFKTAQLRLKNTPYIDQIQIQVDGISSIVPATQAITNTLRKNHHILNPNSDDFTVFNFTQLLQRVGQQTLILTALLVGIAAISLTVGGIGIMNIMLVSVTERTWEIGIRMAIGARRRDILNQFLIEALVLCLLGGVVGLGLGLLIGSVVTKGSGLPFVISAVTIVLPFAVSTGIAIIFGIYPAIRASRLDPIVAIRAEE
ncbi:MAG: ABC transporter permease [Chloroflexi bacterium]|nr:ABC transporter permease [Chloroflexota bacterium]